MDWRWAIPGAAAAALAACSRSSTTIPSPVASNAPPAAVREKPREPSATLTFSNSIGFTVQKGTEGDRVSLVNDARGWAVDSGEILVKSGIVCLEKALRIDRFAVRPGFGIAKVRLNDRRSMPAHGAPVLVDTMGSSVGAAGFIYRGDRYNHVVFNPGRPLTCLPVEPGMRDDPPTGWLTIIFIVDSQAHFTEFRVGDTVLERWPIHVDAPFRRQGN